MDTGNYMQNQMSDLIDASEKMYEEKIVKKTKIAYIAHPVSGDVKGNIEKIIVICREINLTEPDTVPFVPYLSDLYALNDDIPTERERGIKNGIYLLNAGFIDELRLYGNRISNGMQHEIKIAEENGIIIKNYIDASNR